MATDRDSVRWHWPHVWALDQILHDLPTVRAPRAPAGGRVSGNLMRQQMELVRRYKAATYMRNR